jgi:hypothetical protein
MNKVRRNRTHYLKWELDIDELSVRYHFLWQDNAEKEKVYILKHHGKSVHTVISEQMAMILIKEHCIEETEVIAFVSMAPDGTRIHNKTVIGNKFTRSYIGGSLDTETASMEHKFKIDFSEPHDRL